MVALGFPPRFTESARGSARSQRTPRRRRLTHCVGSYPPGSVTYQVCLRSHCAGHIRVASITTSRVGLLPLTACGLTGDGMSVCWGRFAGLEARGLRRRKCVVALGFSPRFTGNARCAPRVPFAFPYRTEGSLRALAADRSPQLCQGFATAALSPGHPL